MVRIIQRGITPILLLLGGIASLTYGVFYHTREVLREEEIEISLAPPEVPPPGFGDQEGFGGPEGTGPEDPGAPSGFGDPDGFDDPMGFGGEPGFDGPPMDMFQPPPEMAKVKQIVLVSGEEPEMVLVRDVTVGGLMLLDSGTLQRTYTGAPPSLCPT